MSRVRRRDGPRDTATMADIRRRQSIRVLELPTPALLFVKHQARKILHQLASVSGAIEAAE